jgi:hypothetical protein
MVMVAISFSLTLGCRGNKKITTIIISTKKTMMRMVRRRFTGSIVTESEVSPGFDGFQIEIYDLLAFGFEELPNGIFQA